MNKHDQDRKNALIRSLVASRERASTALLYLRVNDRDIADIEAAHEALEHIEIALEKLGASAPAY